MFLMLYDLISLTAHGVCLLLLSNIMTVIVKNNFILKIIYCQEKLQRVCKVFENLVGWRR